jgi:hypothetical protein
MSKPKIAITVPTRGRPANLARLAQAAAKTCELEFHIFARLDDDDSADYPELPNVTYKTGPRIFFSASLNELAKVASDAGFTHLALLGDDVLPETKGWDKIMVESLGELGVAYGSDGLENLHGADLPTHVVVPVGMYKRLGWLGLPTTRHLFCDNVWRELGKMTEFIYHPDVKLTHLHRWNKTAPDDNTYQEANDKIKREADRIAFEAWRDGPGLIEAKRLLSVK